jgi:hypothetical protein
MSPFRNRLKTPEEVELERKQRELAHYHTELSELEKTCSTLKSEIRIFEQLYEEILGTRIAAMEELEWQLNGILDTELASSKTESSSTQTFTHFQSTTDLLDDEDDVYPDKSHQSLKSLYRGVAKAVHPDLASDEVDRMRRQELMSLANQAYESGDRKVLEELFGDWEQGTGSVAGMDVASELVRTIRMIARVQQNIHAVHLQIDELKQTDIYRFKMRVADAQSDDIDLLAEMASRLDDDIARSRRRLAVLRGETEDIEENGGPHLETRVIRFPVDRACGMLYIRTSGSADFRDWQWLGRAQGIREVRLDKEVRLDVRGDADGSGLGFLDNLQPWDLQALFLSDIDDSALPHFAHLTGLQEICLSNTAVSDEGISQLGSLHRLQRLSIYQTAVSDEGLQRLTRLINLKWLTCSGTWITEEGMNRFRQKVPGCRAVSFKWRYN